jgi:hypothetical protein
MHCIHIAHGGTLLGLWEGIGIIRCCEVRTRITKRGGATSVGGGGGGLQHVQYTPEGEGYFCRTKIRLGYLHIRAQLAKQLEVRLGPQRTLL